MEEQASELMEGEEEEEEDLKPVQLYFFESFIADLKLLPNNEKIGVHNIEIRITAGQFLSITVTNDLYPIPDELLLGETNLNKMTEKTLRISPEGKLLVVKKAPSSAEPFLEEEQQKEAIIDDTVVEEKLEDDSIQFNSGKSLLFSYNPEQLLTEIAIGPLNLLITNTKTHETFGVVQIPWNPDWIAIIKKSVEVPGAQGPITYLGTFEILDPQSKLKGVVNAVFRFSCFGMCFMTNLVMFKPDPNQEKEKIVNDNQNITTFQNKRFAKKSGEGKTYKGLSAKDQLKDKNKRSKILKQLFKQAEKEKKKKMGGDNQNITTSQNKNKGFSKESGEEKTKKRSNVSDQLKDKNKKRQMFKHIFAKAKKGGAGKGENLTKGKNKKGTKSKSSRESKHGRKGEDESKRKSKSKDKLKSKDESKATSKSKCLPPLLKPLVTIRKIRPEYDITWQTTVEMDLNKDQAYPDDNPKLCETHNVASVVECPDDQPVININYETVENKVQFHFLHPGKVEPKKVPSHPTLDEIEANICRFKNCQIVKKLKEFGIGQAAIGLPMQVPNTAIAVLPLERIPYGIHTPLGRSLNSFQRPRKPFLPFISKTCFNPKDDFLSSCWSKTSKNDNVTLRLTGGGLNDFENHKDPIAELTPFVIQIDELIAKFQNSMIENDCFATCQGSESILTGEIANEYCKYQPACGIVNCPYLKMKKENAFDKCCDKEPSRTCGHPSCNYIPLEYRPKWDYLLNTARKGKGWCGNLFCPNAPGGIAYCSFPPSKISRCLAVKRKNSFASISSEESGCEEEEKEKSNDLETISVCENPQCPYVDKFCENSKDITRTNDGNFSNANDHYPLRIRGGGTEYQDSLSECKSLMRQFDNILVRFKTALGPCGEVTCPYNFNLMSEECKTKCCSNEKTPCGSPKFKSACGHSKCLYSRQKEDMLPTDYDMMISSLPPAILATCGHPKCRFAPPELPPIHWDCPNPLPIGPCKNSNCPHKKKIDILGTISSCGNANCPFKIPEPCSSPFCPLRSKECPYLGFEDKSDDICEAKNCPGKTSNQKHKQNGEDYYVDRQRAGGDGRCLDPECDRAKLKKQNICENPCCPKACEKKEIPPGCQNLECPFQKEPNCYDTTKNKDEKSCYVETKSTCDTPTCPFATTTSPSPPAIRSCKNPNCPFENTLVLKTVPCSLRQYLLCTNPECPYVNESPASAAMVEPTKELSDQRKSILSVKHIGISETHIEDERSPSYTPRRSYRPTIVDDLVPDLQNIEVRSDTRLSIDVAPCKPHSCYKKGGDLVCEICAEDDDEKQLKPLKPLKLLKKRRMPKRQKLKPYIYDPKEGRYPGVLIGHRTCKPKYFKVPRRQGWLWDTDITGLRFRRGWRPGAVKKSIAKVILAHRKLYEPKSKAEDTHDIEQKPTLTVQKKEGAYWVTMNPLKEPSTVKQYESPYMPCTPLKFKVAKPEIEKECVCNENELQNESSSDEGFEFEFTLPAGVPHPERFAKKKKLTAVKETQYDRKDCIEKKEKKEKRKGKKAGKGSKETEKKKGKNK